MEKLFIENVTINSIIIEIKYKITTKPVAPLDYEVDFSLLFLYGTCQPCAFSLTICNHLKIQFCLRTASNNSYTTRLKLMSSQLSWLR